MAAPAKEVKAAYQKDFDVLQQQAKKAGLNWGKCLYGDFLFDVRKRW